MMYYLEKYPDRIDIMNANVKRLRRADGTRYAGLPLDLSRMEYERLEDAYVLRGPGVYDTQLRKRVLLTQAIVGKRAVLSAVRWDEDLPAATDCMYCLELVHAGARIGHLQADHVIYWAHDDNLTNCGKMHGPERMIRVHEGFAEYRRKVLAHFPLSPSQRTFMRSELANIYFWRLGYSSYVPLGRHWDAYRYFAKAMWLHPWRIAYWKSLAACIVRRVLSSGRKHVAESASPTVQQVTR
jgi:hypothetical protein